MTKYLLDANVFIQAKNLHYGLDFCPAFWSWLVQKNTEGKVASIQKIADEIADGQDELSAWAEAQNEGFFLPPDDSLVPALTQVSEWANTQTYELAAISTFLQVADYWLVAYAKVHQYTIVTHEIPANSKRKIKIPNACLGLGIACVSPYEMLRRERAQFILGSGKTAV